MASLERVGALRATLFAPGHGPWITDPAAKVAEYVKHRRERERKLVAAIESGERSREALLDAAWGDVAPILRPAAAIAMQAHLEKLEAEGRLPAGIH
jgi:glyoxylase-like metal-dependent hydrolase (beta-lactamase superfamily II)